MEKRLMISEKLHELLGSDEVHFQPTESVKLKYPCILYSFEDYRFSRANNGKYLKREHYTVTHIYQSIDENLREQMLSAFMYSSFERTYTADGLYHDAYNIYL
jgi:hypothetical protein